MIPNSYIMTTVTINHFNQFLDELGIFNRFWYEFFKAGRGVVTLKYYKRYLALPPERYISSAFSWRGSVSGRAFWETIQTLWHIRIERIRHK